MSSLRSRCQDMQCAISNVVRDDLIMSSTPVSGSAESAMNCTMRGWRRALRECQNYCTYRPFNIGHVGPAVPQQFALSPELRLCLGIHVRHAHEHLLNRDVVMVETGHNERADLEVHMHVFFVLCMWVCVFTSEHVTVQVCGMYVASHTSPKAPLPSLRSNCSSL